MAALPGPQGDRQPGPRPAALAIDWICPCGHTNLAWRTICSGDHCSLAKASQQYTVGMLRPPVVALRAFARGIWACHHCGRTNLDHKSTCADGGCARWSPQREIWTGHQRPLSEEHRRYMNDAVASGMGNKDWAVLQFAIEQLAPQKDWPLLHLFAQGERVSQDIQQSPPVLWHSSRDGQRILLTIATWYQVAPWKHFGMDPPDFMEPFRAGHRAGGKVAHFGQPTATAAPYWISKKHGIMAFQPISPSMTTLWVTCSVSKASNVPHRRQPVHTWPGSRTTSSQASLAFRPNGPP